jgi:hypothetical protein
LVIDEEEQAVSLEQEKQANTMIGEDDDDM